MGNSYIQIQQKFSDSHDAFLDRFKNVSRSFHDRFTFRINLRPSKEISE